jgi:glutamyl-tRNA reductase
VTNAAELLLPAERAILDRRPVPKTLRSPAGNARPSDRLVVFGFNRRSASARFEAVKSAQASRLGDRPDHRAAIAPLVGVERGLLLATCCRVEIHGELADDASRADLKESLLALLGLAPEFLPLVEWRQGADALEHLLWTSLGGDSLIPGETEIVGQLKCAYRAACDADALLGAPLLHHAYQRSFHWSKKLRGSISSGPSKAGSLPKIAVDEAARLLALPDDATTERWSALRFAVVGAGELGFALCRQLARRGVDPARVAIFARDAEEARTRHGFPAGVRALPLGELAGRLHALEFDALLGASGAAGALGADVAAWLPADGRALPVVDLSAPSIVAEPALAAAGARLAFLGLEQVAERHRSRTLEAREALESARELARAKAVELMEDYDRRRSVADSDPLLPARDALMAELKRAAEREAEELMRCLSWSLSEGEKERMGAILRQAGDRLAGRLSHRAVEALKTRG